MKRALLIVSPFVLLALATAASAEDGKVIYRDRGGKAIQSASGKIEAESVAGLRVNGRAVSSADIVEVQYEVPALIRIDYNTTASSETARPAEAIKGYEALLKTPTVLNSRILKRHLEYKVAMLSAARADEGPAQLQAAIAALDKFRKDHPDSWQMIPLTRSLGRLFLEKEPPDVEAARRAYDDLARPAGVPADVRQEFSFHVIDLLMQVGKWPEAQQRLSALPPDDPRVKVYMMGVRAMPATMADSVKELEQYIDKTSDPVLKAVAYNVLGDCYRHDPKHLKDALYAYLWVDVVYNQDPIEVNKAVGRLADVFAELKDEDRARKYRERLRGK